MIAVIDRDLNGGHLLRRKLLDLEPMALCDLIGRIDSLGIRNTTHLTLHEYLSDCLLVKLTSAN